MTGPSTNPPIPTASGPFSNLRIPSAMTGLANNSPIPSANNPYTNLAMPSAMAAVVQQSPPRRRPATTIEVPVPGFREYVGGTGPPLQPLSLLPPRDSTAYIIEKLVWPPLEDSTPTTRRLPYYHIGFTDLPNVKTLVSCDKALDYVSPREIEDWESKDLDRRIEEKERRDAEKKAGKRRAGRPAKSSRAQASDATPDQTSRQASADADAILLAEHVDGPSLSTPKKRKRHEEDEIPDSGSEDVAIRRQLGVRSVSTGTETGRDDETGTNQSVEGDDMATSQSLPPLRPATVPARSSRSSRASSVASESATRRSSRLSTPRLNIPAEPPSLNNLRPTPAPTASTPNSTMAAPTNTSSTSALHPAWAKAFGMKAGQETGTSTTSFPPQPQHKVHGFTPIPASLPRPSKTFTSAPSTPAESDSNTSKKRSGSSSKKSKGKDKTPAKSAEKKPAKKKAKVERAKNGKDNGDDHDDMDDVWKVKALLDDRYDHTKKGKVHMFLVDWEGDYDPSWEPKENIQDDNLIAEYQRRKRAGLIKQDKSQKSMLSYFSKSPFANVNEAFEGDIVNPDKAPTVGTRSDGSHSGDELLVVDQTKGPTSNGKAKAGPKSATKPKPLLFGAFDRSMAAYDDPV